MKYNRKCFFSPFIDDANKTDVIQQFLDDKLPVPRDTFGEEVIPFINKFCLTHYPNCRTQIYLDNSEEDTGFEIFLDEKPFSGKGPLMRIRVIYY